MGVPKFYRWISERYPKINQIVSDNALLPEFDHLYLDMNGIIHGCTHPSDQDISTVLSEREMMLGIMHYLDRIITQIVKPKVSVYMAIDGVAPRAKLNQQRSRRFRSAKDMAEATKDLPLDERGQKAQVFDSNCITPGTEFLAKVSETIQYFIRKKLKEDPAWQNLQIIFSGHDIPGEGEHKIMQHIREMRAQPNYQPNNRHCIYGQDADLIMLGLVTHEPHFTILREVVDFESFSSDKNSLKAVKKFTKESDFQLLHLSVLREYLQIEFAYQQTEKLFDLERIIDDFVFMTFLVGNDFLPHMPTLDIGDGAFDLLFGIYKEQRHGWGRGHYLTESGEISDPDRLEVFLAAIGAVETDILEQREKDEAVYMKKKRRWDKRDGKEEGPSDAELKEREDEKQNDYMTMIEDLMANHSPDEFVQGWKPVVEPGEKDFKGRYYYEKMKLTPIDKDEHWKLRRSYMEGLRWCLAYYYRGCISWGWFYPYHYGPMLSDLIDLPKMFAEITFEMGEPLLPFEQLMGCLPPASSQLVPKLYQWLMVSPESPISAFFPIDFEVDMNGKKNPWEGVNLLPFIDIKLLKDTIAAHCPASKLSSAERKRNTMGKVYRYKFDITCTDIVESPGKKIGLQDIAGSRSSVDVIEENPVKMSDPFKPELIVGTQLPYPGFPSLNVLPIASVELTPIGLNCFGTPSKYPNTILTLHQMPELPPLEQLAENVLGKSLFVNWPMMHEGKVVAISDAVKEIRLNKGKCKANLFSKVAADRWQVDAELMSQMYYIGNGRVGSGGVQIGEIKIRLKLLPLQGMKTNPANGSTKKLFGNEEADVPLQLALWQAPAPDPRFVERGPMTLQDRFPEGCSVVLTKGKFRGCLGTVIGVTDKKSVGVKVQTVPPEMPFGLAIARSVQDSFVSSVDAARILKIHPGVFGKIMGRLQFQQGRYDLGLNLKAADGTCVIGYTRKKVVEQKGSDKSGKYDAWGAGDSVLVVGSRSEMTEEEDDEERIQWEYTPKAIRLVEAYRSKFPQLFAAINKKPNERRYDANDVFGPNGEAWLPVVREWLNKNESAKLPRSPVTTESMSLDAAAAVQKAADVRTLALKKKGFPKESLLKIPGSALYREGSTGATDILLSSDLNDDMKPELGDRIVNLCADGVRFGARGTIIGIHEAGSVEVLMDEEFIGGTSLQGHCANFRGKLCAWCNLLRIAPDNSKGLVDKLVPKGVKQAAVDQAVGTTISSIEGDAKLETHVKSSWDSQVDAVTAAQNEHKALGASTPSRPRSTARAKPTTPRSASRAGSTGRNRVAWREARGPDEKGVGFKGAKRGPSGLSKWQNVMKSKSSATYKTNGPSVEKTAAELKKMLGLSAPQTAPVPVLAPDTAPSDQAAQQLKAMLGVNASSKSKQQNGPGTSTKQSRPNASDGLKAILGVQPNVQEQPSTQPSTAADKLLQIMAVKQPQGPARNFQHGHPSPSSFNFTYVEEGKEPPPPNYPPAAMSLPFPNFPMTLGAMPMHMTPGAMPMHPIPPNASFGMPHHPNLNSQNGPLPQQFPPHGSVAHDDFPPLGSEPGANPNLEKRNEQAKTANVMIPSVVASKAMR